MAAGLRIFDGSRNLILDTSHRVGRVAGAIYLNGTNGSQANAILVTGTPFYDFQHEQTFKLGLNAGEGGMISPQITLNSSGVFWSYSAKNNGSVDTYRTGWLFYGVY
jgi:hypothetical protein